MDDNRERARASARKWHAENAAQHRANSQRWALENPERAAAGKRRAKDKLKAERPAEYAIRHRFEVRGLSARTELVEFALVVAADPCAYCGGAADTLDHIVPVCAGGEHDWTNLTAACHSCNSRKQRRELLPALLSMNGDTR